MTWECRQVDLEPGEEAPMCDDCGSTLLLVWPGPGIGHRARKQCVGQCADADVMPGGMFYDPERPGVFKGWLGKFRDKPVKRRPKASLNWPAKLGKDRCENCRRHRDDLLPGEHLSGDHIEAHNDGGADDPSNIRILCMGLATSCHNEAEAKRRMWEKVLAQKAATR